MKKFGFTRRVTSGKRSAAINRLRTPGRARQMRKMESAAPGPLSMGTQQVLMGLAGFRERRSSP
jgi:hypothetical protein